VGETEMGAGEVDRDREGCTEWMKCEERENPTWVTEPPMSLFDSSCYGLLVGNDFLDQHCLMGPISGMACGIGRQLEAA
jgi:hypothetical protein